MLRARDIEHLHLVLLGVACAFAAATPWLSPWGILLGGAVMGANFWLMRQIFGRLFTPAREPRAGLVFALVFAKFSLLLGLLALLFRRVPLDALAFGVGATLLLVACVAAAVWRRPAIA
jgi:hypothetical protein